MAISDPIFGINLDFALGEDGWKNPMDYNLAMMACIMKRQVVSAAVVSPPGSPLTFDVYIIPAAGVSGAWAGKENQIACRFLGAWHYITPWVGAEFYNLTSSAYLAFNGTNWVQTRTIP